jgi:hypothetical protein
VQPDGSLLATSYSSVSGSSYARIYNSNGTGVSVDFQILISIKDAALGTIWDTVKFSSHGVHCKVRLVAD